MAQDPRVETIRLLTSIDRRLQAMTVALTMLLEQRALGPAATSAVNDAVCNGPHGDPVIKAKDPRDWSGPSMMGRHFSECPPEYLDLLADRFDYFASREEDAQKRRYNELDSKRARAWAARLRSGWTAPTTGGDFGRDDVGF